MPPPNHRDYSAGTSQAEGGHAPPPYPPTRRASAGLGDDATKIGFRPPRSSSALRSPRRPSSSEQTRNSPSPYRDRESAHVGVEGVWGPNRESAQESPALDGAPRRPRRGLDGLDGVTMRMSRQQHDTMSSTSATVRNRGAISMGSGNSIPNRCSSALINSTCSRPI